MASLGHNELKNKKPWDQYINMAIKPSYLNPGQNYTSIRDKVHELYRHHEYQYTIMPGFIYCQFDTTQS